MARPDQNVGCRLNATLHVIFKNLENEIAQRQTLTPRKPLQAAGRLFIQAAKNVVHRKTIR